MKRLIPFLLIGILLSNFALSQSKIGLLLSEKADRNIAEIKAAFDLISKSNQYEVQMVTIAEIKKSPKKLEQFDVIWCHKPDSSAFNPAFSDASTVEKFRIWMENGGNLFLSLDAFRLINILGLEKEKPEVVFKESSDSGYGRMLGFHGFKSHPVFNGLNGGAYVFKSNKDTTVRNIGYYGDKLPETGKVIAVDWDYIFLREQIKLALEYQHGKGKVIAIGAYLFYQSTNVNRLHLEKFTFNIFDYLTGKLTDVEANYWNYMVPRVSEIEGSIDSQVVFQPSTEWIINDQLPVLSRNQVNNRFFDLAGERILVMGKENGGIDEIWVHPFMAFRDYKVGIQFMGIDDNIFWLDQLQPLVETSPSCFSRLYRLRETIIKEILTASPGDPNMVVHYEISGNSDVRLTFAFKTNMRIMWPYSEKVTGSIAWFWDEDARCFLSIDRTGDMVSLIGCDKKMTGHYAGKFDGFNFKGTNISGNPTEDILVSGYFGIDLKRIDQCNVVISGSNLGKTDAVKNYIKAISQPEQVYLQANSYYNYQKSNNPEIMTPDSNFNEGYQWALIGTDRFFVNTPGIGKSFVAGYSTTDYGWDGEHKVNGRPGYAWYFGRDAEWSGFAILQYGDFEKVRLMLETFNKYQDLNGKIYHELSTSGFAHYDASDATPLYLVLAGRYLKHSGDVGFIKKIWPNINKAIEYCYSTDTDADLLIENTNVGHGWEEGGGLFGCHTTFYLASCWAEALKLTSFMAKSIGQNDESEKYDRDALKVLEKINHQFWNENENYFYHGLLPDGSMKAEKSIMPAIPILFNQVELQKSREVAKLISGNGFTSDWGVRIVGESSSFFNPNGYHTGSVWPLFTGWASMADYKTGNNLQGFSNLMSNLLVYKNWAHGFVEEVLNGKEYKPSGVCHHQCWSETMVLQPIFEGMLGFSPDAINNTVDFSPRFPADWDHATVNNLRFGNNSFNFEMKRQNGITRYTITNTGYSSFEMNFKPSIPLNSKVSSVKIDGKLLRIGPENDLQAQTLDFKLNMEKTTEIVVESTGGISLLPLVAKPSPGEQSKGFRVISATVENDVYEILFEGRSGESYDFKVFADGFTPEKFKNATLNESTGQIHTFAIKFPEVDSKYAKLKVLFSVPQ